MDHDFDLIPMTSALMLALHDGDLSRAERELNARIHPDWTLPLEVLALRMHQLEADPTWRPWLLQAVVTRESPTLIGNVGFHGPPGHHLFEARYPGVVEIGYDIVPEHRRRGLCTRAIAQLIDWATPRGAGHVTITTAATNLPSRRIAEKLGFTLIGEELHPTRGPELLYLKTLDPRHRPPASR
jgi:ribosomal-protein-alanine N-acetyltransferase